MALPLRQPCLGGPVSQEPSEQVGPRGYHLLATQAGSGAAIGIELRPSDARLFTRCHPTAPQVWRAPHPPLRGSQLLGRRPLVHQGFLASWLCNGYDTKVGLVGRVTLCGHHAREPLMATPGPPPLLMPKPSPAPQLACQASVSHYHHRESHKRQAHRST